ncbi:type IV pilus modification protein PilV [Dyella silvae]|uniref:type IV pilus modification protein PilV n=1 Tax=Dyella silvae TaxID=2994424 RepID=UPI002264B33F|nr:type IV pilus modification protein PilV [Dyella silvae]
MTSNQSPIVSLASVRSNRSVRARLPGGVYQSGVGLIEVMVAVLVLSIAFLGMAALQATSLSTNNSAMSRSMAAIAVHSIQDAMRADRANATGGVYNTATGAPIKANNCPAASSSLASVQVNAWCLQLASTLGAQATTQGTINCSATGDCTITVQFDDSHAGVGGTSAQIVTTRGIL